MQGIYPPGDPTVDQIASKVTSQVDDLCAKWQVPREVGQDVVKLALFDIVLYVGKRGRIPVASSMSISTDTSNQMTAVRWPSRKMANVSRT